MLSGKRWMPARSPAAMSRWQTAGRKQLRAVLAAKIIGVLDERKLTVRAAQEFTGVAAANFSRIRNANISRFTIDRLMTILSSRGQEIEVSVDVHPRRKATPSQLRHGG